MVTSEAQDATLKRRARRRLIGAIALVLLAVIVLPMVFDPEPRPNAPLVSVRIPGEDSSKFVPKVTPKPAAPEPQKKAEDKPPEPAAAPVTAPEAPKSEDKSFVEKVVEKPAAKPVEKPAPKIVEKRAEKPADKPVAAAGEQFMVQVGAFASPDKVQEVTGQLKEAKLPHYTEPVATAKGQVTRVRLGPFASKEAAEKARERAKALGLNPANPVAK